MTAKEKYNEQSQKINSELVLLKIRLKAHRKKREGTIDWTLVADLGLALERLQQINSFLK